MEQQKLWTRDFTIITLGSAVSMFGNSMAGFALSLFVLDYTDSSFLYALVIALFTLPQLIMPIFSGAILDRFSRRKTIYMLDFMSSALFACVCILFLAGVFNYGILIVYVLILGSIMAVYMVAYQSFYPLLITKGNYSKAYSIASVLETLSALMVPAAAFLYNRIGIAPLLMINAVCFFIAACMETQISAKEEYIDRQKETRDKRLSSGRQMLADVKEGFSYLASEKGLLAIAVFFTFTAFAGGASTVIGLPYFKRTYLHGEYIYMLVMGMTIVGRMIGGLIHYRKKLPVNKKFAIAFAVYIIIAVTEGSYLFFPIPAMMGLCFLTGILGVTSYTIRISATQHYVPDEKKGRFNGAFNMMNTVGSFTGELLAGAVAVVIAPRFVMAGFFAINLLAALVIIGSQRNHVKKIYNTQQ
ncbi:MAG: MFS transporter [Lachnospiraceae bacterium]|nr:MFS transporter [Lachnospiraceae bacterium]